MNTAHRLAAGLLLLAAATAQAADIRPGLWEFRSTRMSAAGMPTCRPRWPKCRSR
jgi:hypothetical protein